SDAGRGGPGGGGGEKTTKKSAPPHVRGTLMAYGTAFYRLYLGEETQFLPLLKGDVPPPPSATTDEILMTYQAKDAPGSRLDVNRLLDSSNLSTNSLGGAVVQSGLTEYDL